MLFDQICGSIAKPHSLHPRSVRKTLELTRPVSLANDGRRHSNSLDPRTKRPSNRAADGVSIWAGNDKMEHRQKFKYDGAHTHTAYEYGIGLGNSGGGLFGRSVPAGGNTNP